MAEVQDFYSLDDAAQIRLLTRLAENAIRHWDGDFRDIGLIKYRENAVFSVRAANGARMALRIHRHGYHTDAELLSELQWMEALARSDFAVPRIIPARNGTPFVTVADPGIPEPRQVDLLTWIDGEPLGQVESSLSEVSGSLFHEMGRLAGALHNHTESWPLPEGFTRHAWDLEGLVGDNPFWGRFWELPALAADQLALLNAARARARDDLAALHTGPHNYGLIHADFVPENLLVSDRGLCLIDFDDAGFGWHMFELATALVFHCGADYFNAMKEGLLAGYRSVRSLSREDEDRLPLFLFLRASTYLGWVHTRSETQTARELTPYLIENACALASAYLRQ